MQKKILFGLGLLALVVISIGVLTAAAPAPAATPPCDVHSRERIACHHER